MMSVSATDVNDSNTQFNGGNEAFLSVNCDDFSLYEGSDFSSSFVEDSSSDSLDIPTSSDSNSISNYNIGQTETQSKIQSSSVDGETQSKIQSSSVDGKTQLNEDVSNSNVFNYSFISRNVKFRSFKKVYTEGKLIYNVKIYDYVKYNGIKYNLPLYGSVVKLKVFTGKNYKNYSSKIGENGIASFNISKLAVGLHKIEIYFANQKKGTASITIQKSNAKVYAPSATVKHKSKSYFCIKISDSLNVLVKNLKLKVKVYTGKKFKTYNIKTNSKAVAKLNTMYFSLGSHKVIISSSNKNLKVKKSSKCIVKKSVGRKTIKFNALAPVKTVKYNQSTYFNIKVSDYFGNPIKNLKLKISVYTGSKFKNYALKTDSKAIAKFNTKNLAIGTHKVLIVSGNKNYNLNKSSKVIVKKSLDASSTLVPNLISLKYALKGDDFCAVLNWKAKNKSCYQILRKSNGNFDVVSTVTANSTSMSFSNDIIYGNFYTYSVREILGNNSIKTLGPHDNGGISLIDRPKVTVDFQNLKAIVKWTKISNATKYNVYRKVGKNGKYQSVAIVDANNLNYTDDYYKSSELVELMQSAYFFDPSINNLFYTVRAISEKRAYSVSKVSYGWYFPDGDFNLVSPDIVSLTDNVLKWGTVPNAEGYLILKKSSGDDVWENIANILAQDVVVQSEYIDNFDINFFYAVQAYSTKNGQKVFSDYDKGFSLKDFSLENANQRILFIGDSISFGSPYRKKDVRHIFSIPYRVAQLLGCVYYNPSIPGATYHDLGQNDIGDILGDNSEGNNVLNGTSNRNRITTDVINPVFNGELPADADILDIAKNSIGETNTRLDEYNIVVLAAGTNDYIDNAILGSLDSNDTSTFNGALNYIMMKIEEASRNRVEMGLNPIKVVFVDIPYSDRTYNLIKINNRDTTPNKIGLTLVDYQNELNAQFNKWQGDSEYLSCYNFKTRDYNIVNQTNCPYNTADNIHFTKFIYGQYGNAFAHFLLDNVF